MCKSTRREIERDPGVEPLRDTLIERVNQLDVARSRDISASALDELRQLARRVESEYLENWQAAPPIGPTIGVEFVARALAAHLRDIGLSPDHLHRWTKRITPDLTNLTDLVSAARAMLDEMPENDFEVFIPCSAPYKKPSSSSGAVRWINANSAKSWLQREVPDTSTERQQGGFLITVRQRDPWAAVMAATSIMGRAGARARVARPSNEFVRIDGWACVAGRPGIFSTSDRSRRVDIGSL